MSQIIPSPSDYLNIPSMQYEPWRYAELWQGKCSSITQMMAHLPLPTPECYASPDKHFRMRAEFRIWHEKIQDAAYSRCYYAMFNPDDPSTPVKIEQFPVAHQHISELMQPLLAEINDNACLAAKLFQVEFICTTLGDRLITLIYHRPLDQEWQQQAEQLAVRLGVQIIGRARKQRLVLQGDTVQEQLTINDQKYEFLLGENTFIQPNASINQTMIAWLDRFLEQNNSSSRSNRTNNNALLELYCGIGNFTIPLARHFDRVLATEISKSSTALARQNAINNGVSNISFARLSGEETSAAIKRERDFRRLSQLDLEDFNFSTLVVDPPRAGLDSNTLSFAATFQNIFYISCNPVTLTENLEVLCETHNVIQFALFDQFPYTQHCECGVILEAKVS